MAKPLTQYVKLVINVLTQNKNIFIVVRTTIQSARIVLFALPQTRFQRIVELIVTQRAAHAQFVHLVCSLDQHAR